MLSILVLISLLLEIPAAAPQAAAGLEAQALEGLKSDDSARRLNSLQYLELHPSDTASGELAVLLKSTDLKVKRAAIRSLGYTRNLGLAGSLIPLLQDPEPSVRVSALFALMRINAANEGERFAALAQDADPYVSLAARTASTYFGLSDHREELRQALTGQDFGSISLAASGLALIGRKEDVFLVTALLKDSRDEVRSYGAQALLDAPYGADILNALMDALDTETYFYVQQAVLRAAVFHGMKAVPLLAERMMRSKPQKELLAEAQSYSGYPELAAALVKHFNLRAEDYSQTLGLMFLVGGEEAIQRLKAEALNPKNPSDRRQEVLIALGKLGDAKLVPALRPLLKDKEAPVRAGACAALAGLGDQESLKGFTALFKDAAPAVRMAALRAVNRLKLTQAQDSVKPLMDDPDPNVREVASRVWNSLQKEAQMGDPVYWLGHDAFLIQAEGKNVYFDPFQLPDGLPKADVVFLTHDHYDHLSPEDLRKVSTDKTLLVVPRPFDTKLKGLPGKAVPVSAGDKAKVAGMDVQAVPAYNPAKQYHPKVYGGVGYIVTVAKTTYYHAGDTDRIPEMKDFPVVDVAFLPVSGTYVMTAQEAAEATKVLKCKKAIPMHYGSIIGSEKDAEEFKKSAACPVEVLLKMTKLP